MENHNGLLMDFTISQDTVTADWNTAPEFLDGVRVQGWRPRTLAGDRGYGTKDGVREMRTTGDAARGPAPALTSGSGPFPDDLLP